MELRTLKTLPLQMNGLQDLVHHRTACSSYICSSVVEPSISFAPDVVTVRYEHVICFQCADECYVLSNVVLKV